MKNTNEMFAKKLIETLTDEELELFSDYMDTLRVKYSHNHNDESLQELWDSCQEIE